ncbi:putative GTP-binding protein [Escovopsis weberi]|uniref:Putative GTP-binding protein n=1 Tax=Escovopsis weberi TaxID=150374 RepID=A0A0M8MSZ0_ESCWE|nr:putative GTP-binding protein [Escovopsis weberi]
MPPRPLPPSSSAASLTLLPFINYYYPSLLFSTHFAAAHTPPSHHLRRIRPALHRASSTSTSTLASTSSPSSSSPPTLNNLPQSRLNPGPDDYAAPNFADKADLTLYAGRGGNGCVSFQREAFLPDGPPNGGDGGHGGNVYIQAVPGETSLHKLARRRFIRAGRGQHGQGSARSGTRGDDVLISVPVGTIVRELERQDPAAEEAMTFRAWNALQKQRKREQQQQQELQRQRQRQGLEEIRKEEEELEVDEQEQEDEDEDEEYDERGSISRRRGLQREVRDQEQEDYDPDADDPQRRKWLLYPGMSKSETRSAAFPRLPRRTQIYQQPPAPIYLDLSRPTPTPILLAAGGIGGLGNPHFTSRDHPRPVFATRGDDAITLRISLELKLLADVGLVGLPNAGKSTLLRALTNSRTRIGSWAFTTLQPNIGTVVLDKYSGRPAAKARRLYPASSGNNIDNNNNDSLSGPGDSEIRTRFTVADIPGLIEGAHLDRGLGIAFLRHVERAGVLAFVVDLAAGDAVAALKALWREVGLYAQMRDDEERAREIEARVDWDLTTDPTRRTVNLMGLGAGAQPDLPAQPPRSARIAGKPWFAVATKADLPETQANFRSLKAYIDRVNAGDEPHPSGADGAWTKRCAAIPVSAINGQGVDRIVDWTVGLLDE